jgi:hypothetical protein
MNNDGQKHTRYKPAAGQEGVGVRVISWIAVGGYDVDGDVGVRWKVDLHWI